jgi:predicted dehydrogenase/threonine dehydrogenase-like Zn-dependent dehydrogenase
MKQVLLKGGGVVVAEIPAPNVGVKNILVAVEYSCISAGTELAGIAAMAAPLYKRALRHPEKVMRAVEMVREQGIGRTVKRIRGMLAAGSPTGYSAAGRVIEVGSEVDGFRPGDRVACAGAGIANHAEVIDVPVNLAVRVPDELSLDLAATVTLGAIALQGVRRVAPTLGETVVVIGLGILGQIAAQLLHANGCRVIGVDLSSHRIALATENGMDHGIDPGCEDHVAVILQLTDGVGADAVLVTAATPEHGVIRDAMLSCRKKGRVVLVGDVGLNLRREDFYQKELDFLISTSYGPGRYDPYYEEGGQDYPLPYVRWTENRNMEAYLRLLVDRRINLRNLAHEHFNVEQADEAYALLADDGEKPLLILLRYTPPHTQLVRKVILRSGVAKAGRIQVAVVGAGGFAQGMHLPNLVKLRADYQVRAIMSRTGTTARAVAEQYEAAYATTDFSAVLDDPGIDLVMITTRHNLHGSMVLQALRAGKHVFVEKPLAIKPDELDEIENFFAGHQDAPVLMTGFNRRFSAPMVATRNLLKRRAGPLIINYRMNAGYLPKDHWVYGDEGGGRNIGEACHIYDLFNYLTDATVSDVRVTAIGCVSGQWARSDNFIATITFDDGSICSLTYTAMGHGDYAKERMDVFGGGKVISMDDYRNLVVVGAGGADWRSQIPEKGQLNELKSLAACLRANQPWPISLEEQLSATRTSYRVDDVLWATNYESLSTRMS